MSKSKYALNEAQIESLAADYAAAATETQRVGMTYLRVLVVGCQAILGTARRGRHAPAAQTDVLNDVAGKFYAAVLRGVTTPDIADAPDLEAAERTRRSLERNRRSTFARAAKSTLASYVSVGGDLRGLEAESVTRDPLLKFVREKRGVSEVVHKLERHRDAMIRLVMQEARGDPGAAKADLQEVISALQFALDGISKPAAVTRVAPSPARVPIDPLTMSGVLKSRPAHARMKEARA